MRKVVDLMQVEDFILMSLTNSVAQPYQDKENLTFSLGIREIPNSLSYVIHEL